MVVDWGFLLAFLLSLSGTRLQITGGMLGGARKLINESFFFSLSRGNDLVLRLRTKSNSLITERVRWGAEEDEKWRSLGVLSQMTHGEYVWTDLRSDPCERLEVLSRGHDDTSPLLFILFNSYLERWLSADSDKERCKMDVTSVSVRRDCDELPSSPHWIDIVFRWQRSEFTWCGELI